MAVVKTRILTILFLCIAAFPLLAQVNSTLRKRSLALNGDTIRIDSLSIEPGTLRFSKGFADSAAYRLDLNRGILIKKAGSVVTMDSLFLEYRVLRIPLQKEYRSKSRSYSPNEERGIFNPLVYSPPSREKNAPVFGGLNKAGSISRGIAVGNNQDLAVNSTLNLQLSGKLSPEIAVNAAITDDNIPIQPDGNTQQLQDFDKVFIELTSEKAKLIAGDFQITRPESYFLNFNKRLQGLSLETRQEVVIMPGMGKAKVKAGGSLAVARGRFHRNTIQGIEGNQGPYRLRGANNEQFIIILSGSEKVYIDGRLLRRGQENDYVIDYNSAEIIFTSRNLMTKDLRIFVEFEYSDRNYARSLYHINTEIEQGRLTTRLNIFSEQDSRNQPLQQQLNEEQRAALALAGDTLGKALVEAVDSVGFTPDLVLYKQIDTLVNGQLYSQILVYSISPDSAIYRATFTNVGANRGNYIQASSNANGRVFRWVAPVDGVPQGNFEPKAQLIPPTRKRIITLGNDYQLSKRAKILTELAFTESDLNTFSDRDQFDDQGQAIRVAAEHKQPLGKDSSAWQLTSTASMEYVSRYFSPQERWRNVEFDRDWNLQQLSNTPADELLPRLQLSLQKSHIGTLNYLFTAFIRQGDFRATQHSLNTDLRMGKNRFQYIGSLTDNASTARTSNFYRHRTLITRDIYRFQLGYKDEFERNLIGDALAGDTLLAQAYQFFDRQFFIQNLDTARQKFNLFYRVRTDEGVRSNDLLNYARAENYGLSVDFNFGETAQLRTITSVRNLYINDTLLTQLEPERTLVNRFELSLRLFKNSLNSTTFYETGSGLETRKEFSYLEVQPGQGVYSWTDYNGNGIKELNEFEIAVFQDQARFIRVFTPTNDFIRVFSTQFNQVFNVKTPVSWNKAKGMKKLASRFSGQMAWRMDSRTASQDMWKAYDPFRAGIDDPEMITLNRSLRNSAFFNRSDPRFGIDFNWQQLSTKALLNNGVESRDNRFSNHRIRWNPGDRFTISLETRNGEKRSEAEFFTNRDFRIRYTEWEPRVSYQPNAAFRLSLNYKYSQKANDPTLGSEFAFGNTAGFDVKWNQADKGSLQARFNFILVRYNGEQNSPIAFEMQEGLRPGENYTWGISYQRTLANNMQLSLNYDGRKSPDVNTVHVGGVQVRLFF